MPLHRLAAGSWCVAAFSLLACSAAAVSGCALFDSPHSLTRTNKLPSLQPPPDAVRLDIVFVERPEGDSLLGDELWNEVDEVASLELETRTALKQNGFRVGVSGANPPQALQTMLGMKSDYAYEPAAEKAKQLVGRQVLVRSGGETEIRVSPQYAECAVDIEQGTETRRRQFDNAHCIYRLTTHRLQDGWVRLDFAPQVHFGAEQLRPVAGETGWKFANGKKVETFLPQRFSVTLGLGEMAVISARAEPGESMGKLFFVGRSLKSHGLLPDGARPSDSIDEGDEAIVQRVLVVRLSDMRNQDDPYPPSR